MNIIQTDGKVRCKKKMNTLTPHARIARANALLSAVRTGTPVEHPLAALLAPALAEATEKMDRLQREEQEAVRQLERLRAEIQQQRGRVEQTVELLAALPPGAVPGEPGEPVPTASSDPGA